MDTNENKEAKETETVKGQPEHQFILEVLGKKPDKSYGGTYAGKPFYRLEVKVEKPEKWVNLKEIIAFKERLENHPDEIWSKAETTWREILNDDYFDKRKLVICSRKINTFSILRWRNYPKEISNGGGVK